MTPTRDVPRRAEAPPTARRHHLGVGRGKCGAWSATSRPTARQHRWSPLLRSAGHGQHIAGHHVHRTVIPHLPRSPHRTPMRLSTAGHTRPTSSVSCRQPGRRTCLATTKIAARRWHTSAPHTPRPVYPETVLPVSLENCLANAPQPGGLGHHGAPHGQPGRRSSRRPGVGPSAAPPPGGGPAPASARVERRLAPPAPPPVRQSTAVGERLQRRTDSVPTGPTTDDCRGLKDRLRDTHHSSCWAGEQHV